MSKPDLFRFEITEILHYRRQSVEFSGSEVLYEIFYLYKSITRIFRPTEEDWIEFWKKINDLDVWGWEESYHNLCLDGTAWSLSIEHEGKSISIRFLHIIRQRGTELKQPDLEFDGRKSEASAL